MGNESCVLLHNHTDLPLAVDVRKIENGEVLKTFANDPKDARIIRLDAVGQIGYWFVTVEAMDATSGRPVKKASFYTHSNSSWVVTEKAVNRQQHAERLQHDDQVLAADTEEFWKEKKESNYKWDYCNKINRYCWERPSAGNRNSGLFSYLILILA